jgi:hypothetical protein
LLPLLLLLLLLLLIKPPALLGDAASSSVVAVPSFVSDFVIRYSLFDILRFAVSE